MESKGDLALKLTNVALINSYPTPWRGDLALKLTNVALINSYPTPWRAKVT